MSRRTEKPFWSVEELHALLRTKALGKNLILFNRITSTNDFLKRLARRGAATGTVILADEQTAGRGRLGRAWQSPPGKGLWFSLLMRPQLVPEKVGMVSLAIAAVIAEALSQFCGHEFHVKWPNDVLHEGKKVCGILCETQISPAGVDSIVAGIGVNVTQAARDFAPEWRARAGSLALACGSDLDRQQVLVKLLHALEEHLFGNLRQRLPALGEKWCARCNDLGTYVTVRPGRELSEGNLPPTTGLFEGIGENGELILRMPGGDLRFFSAGEITLAKNDRS